MTRRLIKAEETVGLGLINRLVDKEDVISKASETARSFAQKHQWSGNKQKAGLEKWLCLGSKTHLGPVY